MMISVVPQKNNLALFYGEDFDVLCLSSILFVTICLEFHPTSE